MMLYIYVVGHVVGASETRSRSSRIIPFLILGTYDQY